MTVFICDYWLCYLFCMPTCAPIREFELHVGGRQHMIIELRVIMHSVVACGLRLSRFHLITVGAKANLRMPSTPHRSIKIVQWRFVSWAAQVHSEHNDWFICQAFQADRPSDYSESSDAARCRIDLFVRHSKKTCRLIFRNRKVGYCSMPNLGILHECSALFSDIYNRI